MSLCSYPRDLTSRQAINRNRACTFGAHTEPWLDNQPFLCGRNH